MLIFLPPVSGVFTMQKRQAAYLAAFIVIAMTAVFSAASVRAEDCTGVLPGVDCTLDEDTVAPLTINQNIILTIDAIPAGGTLIVGHNINGVNGVSKGDIATAGNGSTIIQEADVGDVRSISAMTINAGDIWYVSNNADFHMETLGPFLLDGGIFGVGPDSALSLVSAGIMGGANADIIDFISGGVSLGTTGTIGRSTERISLNAGDDRFLYYQSAGSIIAANEITMGNGDDLMAILGDSVGSIFTGTFFGGGDNDSLVFVSSTATFGSLASLVNMGPGDDIIDFDSGGGVAGGILLADTLGLSTGNDSIFIGDNATLQVVTSFDAGDDDDLITFTSGGFINVAGAAFTMGDGNDIVRFNDIPFIAGTQGLDVSGGSFDMGAGDDSLIFVSNSIGLNATGSTINLGDGNDNITFMSSTGLINSVSGSGFLFVNGGLGTDIISFGSGAAITFGSATGAGNILNVETIDVGNGTLRYVGTIDNSASIINFASAEFMEATTDIAATLTGSGNADNVLFASGATFSGIAFMSAGNDVVTFNSSAILSGTVNMEGGDDSFSIGGGSSLSGIVDGGGDVNDSLVFLDGLTTITGTGSLVNFTSGVLNAAAIVNVRDSGSIAMPLSGTGTLQFGSAGSAANTFNLSNTIDEVNLQVLGDTLDTNGVALGGVTPLAALTISQGAVFSIDADVTSSGVLDVDGTARISPGVSLSADSYNQANGGAFIFEINSDLVSGITTVGQMALSGAGQNIDFSSATGAFDTFSFVLAPGSDGLQTDTISFISAGAGGVATAPEAANITGSGILFDLAVADTNANPQDLELVITPLNTVAGLTDSKNNETLANVVLTDLLNSTDTGVSAIRNALFNAADAVEFNQVLEGARPIVSGSEVAGVQTINKKTFGLINQRLALLRKDAQGQTGISTGNIVKELEAWWQFYAQVATQSGRSEINGYKSTTHGLAAGVDKELFDDGFFGFGLSWGDTTANSSGAGDADTEVTSYQLSLYGDYDFGRAYINAMGSYTYNDIGTSKTSAAGTRTANYHADYYAARMEMGYSFMRGRTRLIPKIMGSYGYYSPEAYAEEGPGAQIITGNSLRTFEVGGGVDMSWLIRNGEGSYFVPELSLGYRYDLADEPIVTTSQFVAGGPTFRVQGIDPGEQAFDLGMGMTYFSEESWELLFNYDFEYKEDYTAHTGTIRAAYKFYP